MIKLTLCRKGQLAVKLFAGGVAVLAGAGVVALIFWLYIKRRQAPEAAEAAEAVGAAGTALDEKVGIELEDTARRHGEEEEEDTLLHAL